MTDNISDFPVTPVPGYQAQSSDALGLVTHNKEHEERLLRTMDAMRNDPNIDQRWLAIARTGFEQAFMSLNRAIFRPKRIALPEDEDPPAG